MSGSTLALGIVLLMTLSLAVVVAAAVVAPCGGRSCRGAAEAPILELSYSFSKATRTAEVRVGPEHTAPWPCSTEELERRIQAALVVDPGGSDGLAEPASWRSVHRGLRTD